VVSTKRPDVKGSTKGHWQLLAHSRESVRRVQGDG
jgi:hypothetical protein